MKALKAAYPENLRDKGLLCEIREAQESNHAEGTKAFAEIRKELGDAATDRGKIKDNQQAIIDRVEVLEAANIAEENHRRWIRRSFRRAWEQLSKKDDGLSIALIKISALLAAPVTAGIGMWKLFVIISHFVVRMFKHLP